MKKKFIIWGIVAVVVLLAIIIFSVKISQQNREIELRNKVKAQQEVCKANFDKMFKTISQLAEIPEQYAKTSKEAFKEIYPQLIEGRYSQQKDGALMKWVTESNPNFDMASIGRLYEKLANAIESNREEFFQEQKKLVDFNREHNAFIAKWPGSWIFSSSDTTSVVIVTSKKTKEAYSTGEENEYKLYK